MVPTTSFAFQEFFIFLFFLLHGGYDKEEVKIFIIIIHSKKMFVQENKHYA